MCAGGVAKVSVGGMQARAAPTDQTQTFWASCALTSWLERWPPFLLMGRVCLRRRKRTIVSTILVWAAEASWAMQRFWRGLPVVSGGRTRGEPSLRVRDTTKLPVVSWLLSCMV